MIPFLEKAVSALISFLVPIFELIGIFVITVTTLSAFVIYVRGLIHKEKGNDPRTPHREDIKFHLASGLALSLEFKMAAEILKTVLVQDMNELIVLGAVILLRGLLSILIHFEMKQLHEPLDQASKSARDR